MQHSNSLVELCDAIYVAENYLQDTGFVRVTVCIQNRFHVDGIVSLSWILDKLPFYDYITIQLSEGYEYENTKFVNGGWLELRGSGYTQGETVIEVAASRPGGSSIYIPCDYFFLETPPAKPSFIITALDEIDIEPAKVSCGGEQDCAESYYDSHSSDCPETEEHFKTQYRPTYRLRSLDARRILEQRGLDRRCSVELRTWQGKLILTSTSSQ